MTPFQKELRRKKIRRREGGEREEEREGGRQSNVAEKHVPAMVLEWPWLLPMLHPCCQVTAGKEAQSHLGFPKALSPKPQHCWA